MIEPALVVVRLLQYLGAVVVSGSSLFFVYGLPRSGAGAAAETPWARPLLAAAAALLALASLIGIPVQASVLAGSFRDGFTPEAVTAVAFSMDLGKAALVRTVASIAALVLLLVLAPGRTSWLAAASFGTIAAASLAWMGHGAATAGAWGTAHLAANIVHAITASVWIGALLVLFLLAGQAIRGDGRLEPFYLALRRFSRIGIPLVGLLVVSGLVNSWVLVGPDNVQRLLASSYGQLLVVKIALFGGMVGFAAMNRHWHTPALAADLASSRKAKSLSPLRKSVALELALAVGVLAAVAWLGTLMPTAAA